MKRIGLFGGTFNPVHCGHLELAEYAHRELQLAGVTFIPSASPPHKTDAHIESFEHRLEMLRIAVERYQYFSVSEIEGLLASPSYSIDMLNRLISNTTHKIEYYFIIGIDAFLEIHLWKEFQEALSLVHFIVAARYGISQGTVESYFSTLGYEKKDNCWYSRLHGKKIYYLEEMVVQVSSSELRGKFGQAIAVTSLPSAVRKYVEQHGLYGSRNCKKSISG